MPQDGHWCPQDEQVNSTALKAANRGSLQSILRPLNKRDDKVYKIMRSNSIAAGIATLLVLSLLSACAVDPEARLHVTAMATFIDDDEDRNVEDGLAGFQLGVGNSFGENYKAELALVGGRLNADGFDADQEQFGISVDIMRKLGSSSYFYPYAVLGFGHLQTNRQGPSGPSARDYSGAMVSVGAGVITPFYVLGQAVRVEMRLRNDTGDKEGSRYQDGLLSIGLHFPLGKPVTLRTDSDGDGVDDRRDKCEGTKPGAKVDSYGCARDEDSDGDGIPDAIDMCGGSKAGQSVDEYGCSQISDSDGDGVEDYADECPDTREGVRVDSKGCPGRTTKQSIPDRPAPRTVVAAAQLPSQLPRQSPNTLPMAPVQLDAAYITPPQTASGRISGHK